MFYSPGTGGFYSRAIHAGKIPADAIEISSSVYASLLAGLSQGKVVQVNGEGLLILIDPPPAAPPSREQIETQRLRAYADPLTGSDRYFAESQRESLLGNAEAAESAKALGLARFAEIQAEYPWPAE